MNPRFIALVVFAMLLIVPTVAPADDARPGYQIDFKTVAYGHAPDGWADLTERRPSRNWAVDGNGFVRFMLKNAAGLFVYDPSLGDGVATISFKKTPDPEVYIGLAARVQDRSNYYTARLIGDTLLELNKVKDGEPQQLAELVTLRRYREGEIWRLSVETRGDDITARLHDETGMELARVDGKDEEFSTGRAGIEATPFAAVRDFRIESTNLPAPATPAAGQPRQEYLVLQPVDDVEPLNTPFDKLGEEYDVIIAGGGTGGTAAAIQAVRLGATVLLLEETDWLGGQMSAAAVSSMDDAGCYRHFPVRERGIYREFHESMVAYYYTRDKDPFNAYYSGPTLEQQLEGGYEPKVTRAMLYALIEQARTREGARLDVRPAARVVEVRQSGDAVTGATIEFTDEDGKAHRKQIASKVLIDATEYGDVIPLTGARYRVGTVTSDNLDPAAPVQDHTWTAVLREYPQGIPDHLRIKDPPPDYDEFRKKYAHYDLWGPYELTKPRRMWRVYFTWRGMADGDGPLTGKNSERRHTQCGFNGGNDYPVSVATIEDPQQRILNERDGIHRTLSALYYFQNELGINWSLAEDEGYATPYNRRNVKRLGLRDDLAKLAVHMPQMPYVRESRRIIGVKTVVAHDLGRYDKQKLFTTSVAMGDYFMDLHRTEESLETDLDSPGYPTTDGPFQVIFEAFIPEKIDGFLAAEKNLSQSRLVSGATRLQPVTMLTGQAAGTIAAMAVKQNVQPRSLDVMQVQQMLLDGGSTLVQRWYADVPWGTPIWRATQMLTLHGVMDRPAPLSTDHSPLGSNCRWGVDEPLKAEELSAALHRLAELKGDATVAPLRAIDASKTTAGQFAIRAAKVLVQPAKPAR